MPSTARGLPYPAGSALNNVPADMGLLASAVDARLPLPAYTSAQVAALTGADRWTGRMVFDATAGRAVVWDGPAWRPVPAADLDGTAPGPLVNGSMEIWQRGTTGAMSTGGGAARAWGPDRWCVWRGFYASGGSWSRIPLTRAVDAAPARYALRLARAPGDAATYELIAGQGVESGLSWPWAGRQATVSAWLRAGPGLTGTVRLQLAAGTGTDEDLAAGFTGQTYPVDATAAVTAGGLFVRVTGTGTVPAGATQLGVRVAWTPTGTAPAGAWLDVAAVQLDAGPVARPWRGEEPSGLLAACRRTYRPLSGWQLYGVVHETTGPAAVLRAAWDPGMRAVPAVTVPAGAQVSRVGYTAQTPSEVIVLEVSPTFVAVTCTGLTGAPVGAPYTWDPARPLVLAAEL